MNKKAIALCVCFVTICTLFATAIAQDVMPCADAVFGSATAFLSSSKTVVFDCITYDIYDRISITSVWLEKQVNGDWEYVKALTPPSYVAENMADYGAVIDYSSEIGTGTLRVGFTVDADGYSISRYSNSRSF